MKLKLAAVAIAAMVLTGCTTGPADPPRPASTPQLSANQKFDQFLIYRSPELKGTEIAAEGVGKAFCGMLIAQMSFNDAVAEQTSNLQQYAPRVTSEETLTLIMDAVNSYCPQYAPDLSAYLTAQ